VHSKPYLEVRTGHSIEQAAERVIGAVAQAASAEREYASRQLFGLVALARYSELVFLRSGSVQLRSLLRVVR
jgi:hypothetical protein